MDSFISDKDVEISIKQMEIAAINFGSRFINDSKVRALYMEQTKKMSLELVNAYKAGVITPKQAAVAANEMRNEIMTVSRSKTSDIGKAKVVKLKAKGLNLETLLDKYAKSQFGKSFAELTESEASSIYKKIVQSAGKANPKVSVKASNLGKAGRSLWVLSICIAVYNISSSNNKIKTAGREATNIGGGFAGGAAGGATAGIWFGPIGVAVGVVVGGVLGSIISDQAYIELAGPDGKFARSFIPRFTNVLSTHENKMASALITECTYELDKVMAVFFELNDKYFTDVDDIALAYVGMIRTGRYPLIKQALSLNKALKNFLIQVLDSGWTSSSEKECIRYLRHI
ncbi:hypothetical protein CWC16_14195 [Pseudoalteromonas sp. S3776]|uniref:hypothetical protein n=1 Tax=Pseudoalteromonas sp. S3776 TaxID=579544 RepID=UPI001107C2BD|nr:hypothetical protein [Pseudoalteromonas sp. S3776]TMO79014.1 hypothetical protein CWC16_14195 [Pseudoalteromonas sp. S3776]